MACSVVKHMSDRVAVMYLGKIVELAPAEEALPQPAPRLHQGAAGRDPDPDPSKRRERRLLQWRCAFSRSIRPLAAPSATA